MYTLKTSYSDGTTQDAFEGAAIRTVDFIARLAALIPKPRVNLTRYHGILVLRGPSESPMARFGHTGPSALGTDTCAPRFASERIRSAGPTMRGRFQEDWRTVRGIFKFSD